MDTVYVETSVIGHLSGRLHPNAAIAARQQATRAWWAIAPSKYRLFTSQVVRDECGAGDIIVAIERMQEIQSTVHLVINDSVRGLAAELTAKGAIPPSEPRDALHIAISAVHGIQYLVTWNFKHIANATLRNNIETVCRAAGFEPPVICTPEELEGSENDA